MPRTSALVAGSNMVVVGGTDSDAAVTVTDASAGARRRTPSVWRGTAGSDCPGSRSWNPTTGANALQVVPFADVRVSIVRPLPAGTDATRSSVVQSTVVPASNVSRLERAWRGVRRHVEPVDGQGGSADGEVAHRGSHRRGRSRRCAWRPRSRRSSTRPADAVQSIRKRCGVPSQLPGMTSSIVRHRRRSSAPSRLRRHCRC